MTGYQCVIRCQKTFVFLDAKISLFLFIPILEDFFSLSGEIYT